MSDVTRNYLRFRVGAQWFGLPVDDVIEVLQFMWLTEPPGLPDGLLGILTLRDMLVPVIDLPLRFGLGSADLRLDTPVVVARTDRGPIGLVVDDTDEILPIEASQITSAEDRYSPYVAEVAKCMGYLLLLLDPAMLYPQVQSVDAEIARE